MKNQEKTPYLDVPSSDQGLVRYSGVSASMALLDDVSTDLLDIAEQYPETEEFQGMSSDFDEGMTQAGIDGLTPVDGFLAMQGRTSFLTEV